MKWKELFLVMATDDFRPHFDQDVTILVNGEYHKVTLDFSPDKYNIILKEETNE